MTGKTEKTKKSFSLRGCCSKYGKYYWPTLETNFIIWPLWPNTRNHLKWPTLRIFKTSNIIVILMRLLADTRSLKMRFESGAFNLHNIFFASLHRNHTVFLQLWISKEGAPSNFAFQVFIGTQIEKNFWENPQFVCTLTDLNPRFDGPWDMLWKFLGYGTF